MQPTQRTHPSRHGESFIVKSPAIEDNKCLGMRGLDELVVRYSIADESDIPKRRTWPRDDASRLSVVPLYLEAEHPVRCYDRYNLGLGDWTTLLRLSLLPFMMPQLGSLTG